MSIRRLVKDSRRAPVSQPRRAAEGGETLLELLITVLIIAVGVSALLGSIMMSVRGSSQVGGFSALQAAMRSYADALTNTVDVAPTPSSTSNPQYQYRTCRKVTAPAGPTPTPPLTYPSPSRVGVSIPSGMTVVVSKVEYWNGKAFVDTGTTSACADAGMQRVTLTGTQKAANGPDVTDTMTVIIRRPCATLAATAPTATPSSGPC